MTEKLRFLHYFSYFCIPKHIISHIMASIDINTIDTMTLEAAELLKTLIATPSVSRKEDAAADKLELFMKSHGLATTREANNIWSTAEHFDPSKPTLLLNAHIDTVAPAATWTRDPYSPTLEGDRLYGLGSNDCGGGLVTLLQAFRMLSSMPLRYNLVFLASAEEEVSGADGIRRALPLLPHIDLAIVGEPTGMQPAIAERGLMVVDAVAHGQSGHAARNEGINALYIAMDDIAWIRNYKFPETSSLLGDTKMTVTIISAGTQHNVIPDTCRFTIDIRSNEHHANEDIFAFLQSHLKSELKARSFHLKSSMIPAHHPLVQSCVAMGMTPFGSPTLSDQALMPWPSMKLGPGQSSRSHTADEYICLSEMRQALQTYVSLLTQ